LDRPLRLGSAIDGILRYLIKNKHLSFGLALLLHLLLFLSMSVVWTFSSSHPTFKEEEKPGLYIPSYVYQEAPHPIINPQEIVQKKQTTEDKPTSTLGIKKINANRTAAVQQPKGQPIKITRRTEEPIHLIGKNKLVKPLIKLLARALGARLMYPKIAMDFNLRGTVYISFTVNPDGRITNIKLVKSSHAEVLDEAGLKAVAAMSPVSHVDDYLKQPESVIVGIIF
jgi:TonB family protein